MAANPGFEPSLIAAAWRYRWLVVVVVGLAVAIGAAYELVRPEETLYEASATVVLQEPVLAGDVVAPQTASDQFVTTQVEILRSSVVSTEAATLLTDEGVPTEPADVIDAVEVTRSAESPLVTIVAIDFDPNRALSMANGVAEAYRQVSRSQATAASDSAVLRINAQLEQIGVRLDEIGQELAVVDEANPDLARIQAQATGAIAAIADLQAALVGATEAQAAVIRQEIADFRVRLEVYDQVQNASPSSPAVAGLLEEQQQNLDRRALLLARRDEVSVDADLAPDALALVQPAVEPVALGAPNLARIIAVAVVLGLAAGVGLAYFLATSRRSLRSRNEPEAILGAPLLAEVPDFDEEGIDTKVPVRDLPRSAAAEAYRFAAGSLEVTAGNNQVKTIMMVSATLGHGKTTTVVNTALAAAVHGRSVLVMDCDFGNQEASRLLTGSTEHVHPGITDVVEGVVDVDRAGYRIDFGDEVGLAVMGRGTRPRLAATVLRSTASKQLFQDVGQAFDLVFVDGPPLLQVAYASNLAEYVDGLVVVVAHETSYAELEELVGRLRLLNKPLLGYVYNRSPLRPEMTASEGSMMDVLGEGGFREDGSHTRRQGRQRASGARR